MLKFEAKTIQIEWSATQLNCNVEYIKIIIGLFIIHGVSVGRLLHQRNKEKSTKKNINWQENPIVDRESQIGVYIAGKVQMPNSSYYRTVLSHNLTLVLYVLKIACLTVWNFLQEFSASPV